MAPIKSQGFKGCMDCGCSGDGTVPDGVCDHVTGSCPCLDGKLFLNFIFVLFRS